MKLTLLLSFSVLSAALVGGGCSSAFAPADAVGTWELRTVNGGAIPGMVSVRIPGDSLPVDIEAGHLAFGSGNQCAWTVETKDDGPYSVYECAYTLGGNPAVEIGLAAVTLDGTSDSGQLILTDPYENVLAFRKVSETPPTDFPAKPDFERALGPGEYQASVTGDITRGVEGTGATMQELGNPPFTGGNRVLLHMGGYDGASFNLCEVPLPQSAYGFDAQSPFVSCPSDPGPGRAAGGLGFQLGSVPLIDMLDCYPSGYGSRDLTGVLTITSVTADEIEGEVRGSGVCSRHPFSEIRPMGPAVVSVRLRFRAIRTAP